MIGIAVANPARSSLIFPPIGVAYRDSAESHVLWRWIGVHAPDLVLVAGSDPASDTALCAKDFVTITPLSSIEPAPFPDIDATAIWRPDDG